MRQTSVWARLDQVCQTNLDRILADMASRGLLAGTFGGAPSLHDQRLLAASNAHLQAVREVLGLDANLRPIGSVRVEPSSAEGYSGPLERLRQKP